MSLLSVGILIQPRPEGFGSRHRVEDHLLVVRFTSGVCALSAHVNSSERAIWFGLHPIRERLRSTFRVIALLAWHYRD
jgi:hypothetical protein